MQSKKIRIQSLERREGLIGGHQLEAGTDGECFDQSPAWQPVGIPRGDGRAPDPDDT